MSLTDTNPNFENKVKSYKFMCSDGFDCKREAIERINAGTEIFGNVSLNLCLDCKKLIENQVFRSTRYE